MNKLKFSVLLSSLAFLAACGESSKSTQDGQAVANDLSKLKVISTHTEQVKCTSSTIEKISYLNKETNQFEDHGYLHFAQTVDVTIKVESLSDKKSERRFAQGIETTQFTEKEEVAGSQDGTTIVRGKLVEEAEKYSAETIRTTEQLSDGSTKITNKTKTVRGEGEKTYETEIVAIEKRNGAEIFTEYLEPKRDALVSKNYRTFEVKNGIETISTNILTKPYTSTFGDTTVESISFHQVCVKRVLK